MSYFFFKSIHADQSGYDRALNKQEIVVGRTSDISLFIGPPRPTIPGNATSANAALRDVKPNNPAVVKVIEVAQAQSDQQDFLLEALIDGHAMLEARSQGMASAPVDAFMQVDIRGRFVDPRIQGDVLPLGLDQETYISLLGGGGTNPLSVSVTSSSGAVQLLSQSTNGANLQCQLKTVSNGSAVLEAKNGAGVVRARLNIIVGNVTAGLPVSVSTGGAAMVQISNIGDLFPPRYPDRLAPDPKLQKSLDDAIAKQHGWNHPIAIAHLRRGAAKPWAHFKGDEVDYIASMGKVAALYSAFEFREGMQAAADLLGNKVNKQTFLAMVTPFVEEQIAKRVAKLSPFPAGKTFLGEFPRYVAPDPDTGAPTKLFSVTANTATPGGQGVDVEFSPQFRRHLTNMMTLSSNGNTRVLVHHVGYGYINAALESGGFFDASSNRGIWLAADYSNDKDYPSYMIPCQNNKGKTGIASTPNSMLRWLTLLHGHELIRGNSKRNLDILDLFRQAALIPAEVFANRSYNDFNFTITHTKVGYSPEHIASEASIIRYDAKGNPNFKHGARNEEFAVVWQDFVPDRTVYTPVADVITDTLEAFLA